MKIRIVQYLTKSFNVYSGCLQEPSVQMVEHRRKRLFQGVEDSGHQRRCRRRRRQEQRKT
jgi:hypothetical protein